MKKILAIALVSLAFSVHAQTKIKIIRDHNTLQVVNGDTSYIFNAYVVKMTSATISSVQLVFKDYTGNNNFSTVKDTTYIWSQITNPNHLNDQYKTSKYNGSTIKVCLGRMTWSQRQRFLFTVTGSNFTFNKEYNF